MNAPAGSPVALLGDPKAPTVAKLYLMERVSVKVTYQNEIDLERGKVDLRVCG